MQVTLTKYDGPPPVTIIRADGVFDATSTEDFMVPTQSAIKSGVRDMLLDLSKVSYMSSIGIGIINALYYELHPYVSKDRDKEVAQGVRDGTYKAPHLKILCPPDRVYKVMCMAGIDQYIQIYDDEDLALQSFSSE